MLALQFEVDSLELKIESEAQGAAENVRELGDALAYVKAICKGGLGLASVANALEKINKFSGTNLKIDVDAGKTKELADKLKDVTTESKKSEDALKDVTEQTKTFGTTTESINLRSLVKGFVALRRIVQPLKKIVKEATGYVETINLAQVAMKGYFEEAKAYADLVNDKLGVDPALWLKEQATFMAMATGFGFAEDKAYKLSKALTELSYDISSLYNEDINKASLRLQSALAGEIEPIRRLGISISQATLEEFALAKGITESVSAMTEQEKSLLRTLKLIEDSSKIGAVGDLARTIEQPANALRVLNQQITQLTRTVGTTFIPALIQIVPYLQAGVELLTDIVERIATLVGFEMPEWDNSSWDNIQNGAEGAAGAIDDATEAVKKLKRQTLGFDELNVLSANEDTTDNLGGTSDWIKDLEIPSLWDENVLNQIADKTSEIKENIKPIVDGVLALGTALLLLKIPDAFNNALSKLYSLFTNKTFTTGVSIGLAIQSVKWSVAAGFKLSQGDIDVGIKDALGSVVAAGLAGGITFGPTGAILGMLGSLAITVTSYYINADKAAEQDAIDRYKNSLSDSIKAAREEIKAAAEDALEVKTNLKLISGEISAEDALKFQTVRDLVEKLYGLVDVYNEDPTNETVLSEIEQSIEDINGLGLDGLSLAFESVNGVVTTLDGTVLKTKDDALAMVKAVEDQAKLMALATAKAQAEIEGAKAKAAYDSAVTPYLQQRAELQAEYEQYAALIAEIQKEIDSYRLPTGGNPLKFLLPNKLNEYITLNDHLDEYQAKLKAIKSALADGDDQFAPIMDAYKEASKTIELFDSEWQKLSAEINGLDFDPAAKAVTAFTARMNTDFASLSSIVKDASKEIKEFVSGAKAAFQGSGSSTFASKLGGAFMVQISAFADGGFPTMGSLFIANEAGPEMVGTIGGRPAVANNDQIVAGVANGVASANATQNALLREQNNILLEILNKTGAVSLDGKMLDRSIEQYRNNRGASIMSGGVR